MAPTTGAETFKHEGLPDPRTYIRLLEIVSVDETRAIQVHCKLTTWAKRSAPEYTAISYTWGDASLVVDILINGNRMEVRRNCEDVLRQPCRIKGGYFWIDAICINQADNDEKGFQVSQMGTVFKRASQTLACVGRHQDNSNLIFEEYRLLQEEEYLLAEPTHGPLDRFRRRAQRKQIVKRRQSIQVTLFDTLDKFLTRPYFQRVWIYQELFFGKNIHVCCEDGIVDMSKLWKLYKDFQKWVIKGIKVPGDTNWDRFHRIVKTQFLFEAGVERIARPDLEQMTKMVGRLHSEDIRDRVFGTLAIIKWNDSVPIQPDYGKDAFDLSVEVLQRIGTRGDFDWYLSNTIRIARLLGLQDRPSSRLVDELQARRSRQFNAPPVDMREPVENLGYSWTKFWGKRIYLHDTGWQCQTPPLEEDHVDRAAFKSRSATNLPQDLPGPNTQKWSKGRFWDVRNTDILLPREAQPRDWILVACFLAVGSTQVDTHLGFVARDVGDGELLLIGKALVAVWNDRSMLSAWKGSPEFEVYLDPEDAIPLAHSFNWERRTVGLVTKEDQPYMIEVDNFFETRLCGESRCSYARCIQPKTAPTGGRVGFD